jgi:hypothetical protein
VQNPQNSEDHRLEPCPVNPAEVVLQSVLPNESHHVGSGEPDISSVHADAARPSQETPLGPSFDAAMMHAEELSEIANTIGFSDAS